MRCVARRRLQRLRENDLFVPHQQRAKMFAFGRRSAQIRSIEHHGVAVDLHDGGVERDPAIERL
jgi:hypothetical protein